MSELGAVSGQLLRDLSGRAKELEDGGKAQVRVLRQIRVRKSYLPFPPFVGSFPLVNLYSSEGDKIRKKQGIYRL